jgi:hypothetical protein
LYPASKEEDDMQTTRMPASRNKSPEPVSGERDAWFARPPRDGLYIQAFFDSRASLATVSPETALMYAVLEDAFLCLQKTGELTPIVRSRAREAGKWFLSDDSRWIFSFLPICEALGLDPGYMRKKLKDWYPSALDTTLAKR